MPMSSASSVCAFTPDSRHQSSSPGLGLARASTTSACSRNPTGNYNLTKDQILVKVSHVNEALLEFNTEMYDDEEQEDCHFVRIVRMGPMTQNKSTRPGVLVVVQRKRGIHLAELSEAHGESYYLLLESDIKTYIAL